MSTFSLRKSIVICGKTGSGKSTAIGALAKKLGYKIVSFGSMVRAEALALGIDDSRETLQNLGYKMFVDLGAKKLLAAAIEHAKLHNGESALFDGVRHHLVLSAIKEITAEEVVSFYLEVDETERFKRYLARNVNKPSITFEQFQNFDYHPIEAGIQALASVTDSVIDASGPSNTVFTQILRMLSERPL